MEVDTSVRGEAAYKTLRGNFKILSKAVTGGDIPEDLYAHEIIDEDVFEIAVKQTLTDKEKGRRIVRELQKAVQVKPNVFDEFCTILAESSLTQDLSQKLKDEYQQNLIKTEQIKQKKTGTAESKHKKGEFDRLKSELEVYKKGLARQDAPTDALIECIKVCIQQYIETALKAGGKVESLQDQMWSLCYQEFLIPFDVHKWTLQQVEQINTKLATTESLPGPLDVPETTQVQAPLFSKDSLYHASVCCLTVSTCTAANYLDFLSSNFSRHMLEEASMSISENRENIDRYLIAKQRDTVYVAFQSEATLSTWMRRHNTFDEGLDKQTDQIPLRFFVEQLWDHKRIVLTGFSFGGMLACCVAANIWKKSPLLTQVLEKNVICITFGQPLIDIPLVHEVTKMFPKFETTVHSIFDKGDLVPRLLRYFGVGCRHGSNTSGKVMLPTTGTKTAIPNPKRRTRPVATPPVDGSIMNFKRPFASTFLNNMAVLQDTHTYSGTLSNPTSTSPKTALAELKSALGNIISYAEVDPTVVFGTCYVMSSEVDHISWSQVPKQMAAQELGYLDRTAVEKLDNSLFKRHNMDDYRRKMLKSYLEPDPEKYSVPTQTRMVKDILLLKPQVKAVKFHEYPNEHAIVLEGDNLWFCHQIRLGEKDNIRDITNTAQNISRQSIQFNFTPEPANESKRMVADDGQMKVTLYSHFSNPIRRRIKVELEPYTFSQRQLQLAKYTPSEIIRLAYWSAMLEWHPKEAGQCNPSQRYKEVARFLEEVVKVVPIESIFYGIAYNDNTTALRCSKALMALQPSLLPSQMMLEGLQSAVARMRTGVSANILDQMVATAIRQMERAFPLGSIPLSVDVRNAGDNKLAVTVQSITLSSLKPRYSDVARHTTSRRARALSPPVSLLGADSQPQTNIAVPTPPEEILVPISVVEVEGLNPSLPSPEITEYLEQVSKDVHIQLVQNISKGHGMPDVVCNLNIEEVYPYQRSRITPLQSPVEILRDARKKLTSFVKEAQEFEDLSPHQKDTSGTEASNEQMLELIREIHDHDLNICAALLGGFMEQQIHIPLLKSPMDTAKVLSTKSAPVALGVWALFSLDLAGILSHMESDPLLVEIVDYIAGIFSKKPSEIRDRRYAGKLQFMLQGIKKTVSCSSQYISYSLEHQLCSNLKFPKSISVNELITKWDTFFKGDALSLVAKPHRPLIARWLKWTILIHDLREALAKYTCVGVIGLINSGKSQLVKTLFKVRAQVGTRAAKRTTVPFMYNLDGFIDGLDVIDFPGVDDKDHSVPDLAKLLVGLAQVVVFVVDYRKLFSDPAKGWIRALEAEDVPVLVCLTHADRLYAECIEEDHIQEPTPYKKRQIEMDLFDKEEKIGRHPSRTMNFYSFYKPPDSSLTPEMLKEAGIGSPQDVGDWLVETFKSKLDQQELATKLYNFIHTKEQ